MDVADRLSGKGTNLDVEVRSSQTADRLEANHDWTILDWGEVPYEEALARQLALSDVVIGDRRQKFLVFCSHPPVVTVGRRRVEGDVFAWDGPLIEVNRGGRATYHGPNQLVIYPILSLDPILSLGGDCLPLRPRDIGQYVRFLEQIMVRALARLTISASGKRDIELLDESGRTLETTGIWVGERKLGSVGVAVRQWVAYHGIALNMLEDANAFKGIHPCGFNRSIMTSVERELGRPVARAEVVRLIRAGFIDANRETMNS